MNLLIAIPIYNEKNNLERILDQIRPFGYPILAINDGSTDGSGEILGQHRDVSTITHFINRGYGASLIDAFRFACRRGYDWVLTMDCDDQHPPDAIPKFVEQVLADQYDIISGSRYMVSDPMDDEAPSDRRAINIFMTELLNSLTNLNLTDSFCGYKAHRVEAMMRLDLSETGYGFPMQFWPRVAKAGLNVMEIPVPRIYKDPTRHFGGQLDDSGYRLKHYLDILKAQNSWKVPELKPCCCR